MKNVLVSKTMLPLSMKHCNHSKPYQPAAAPCAPQPMPMYSAEPIHKAMLEVMFENDELAVLRDMLTQSVYTVDKSQNIVMEEPTAKDAVVYHHLRQLGISELNMYHYDALMALADQGVIGLAIREEDYV